MKNTSILLRLLTVLLLAGGILSLFACSKDDEAIGTRIYVRADSTQAYLDVDLSLYSEAPTLYEILRNDDSLEADIDKTTNPDTVVSVCNVYAASGEAYVIYSSDAADAPEGTEPISYDGIAMYRVSGDYMALPIKEGYQYLIRLESAS